jgi:hypothetical protein
MAKKTKISLHLTLSETILEQAIIEQTVQGGYYDGMSISSLKDYGRSMKGPGSARWPDEQQYTKSWKKKRDSVAKKIVDGKWENWTTGTQKCGTSIGTFFSSCSDDQFYKQYKNGIKDFYPGHTKSWKYNVGNKQGVDWKINHYEAGEPGWCDKWWHCVLPIIEIGALLIPGIGWGVALGISMAAGLTDAALYYSEGDEEMAGLVGFLTILPGVPAVVKKFPFVKSWAKGGTQKIAGKVITGEGLTLLEQYQLRSLTTETAQEFLEKEVKAHLKDIVAKDFIGEAVEIGGKKITKEMVENAVEKGFLEITIDGVKAKLSKEMVEALTKTGLYTAKQQSKLIQFGKAATPYVIAGLGYFKIMEEMAKSGIRGPKKLIEKLWGIDLDDTTDIKIGNFFQEVATDGEFEVDENIKTQWDFIKFIFNSSGSAKDNELMTQAIKNGWHAFEEGKTIVPKKYRTEGYKEWVNNILSNKSLLTWFGSDGSDKDNNMLLSLMFENPGFDDVTAVPEKYRTETYKKNLEKRKKSEMGAEDDISNMLDALDND